jgi:hypothetical protein
MAKTKKINGQPMSHWEREGKKLVVWTLVRAATKFGWSTNRPELQSIIHKIAADRIMELANAEDSSLVQEALDERSRCQTALVAFFASWAPDPPSKRKRK